MLKFRHHPGSGFVKVICDVCGGQFYRKDTLLIRDKYNFQNGLVVCRQDVDRINEQILPNHIIDHPVSDPASLRPERADSFATNANDDRVPGAPKQLQALAGGVVTPIIELFWEGPDDNGSSPIIGYKVVRAYPQGGYFEIVIANTNSGASYYADVSSDLSLASAYKVAAINSFGTGAYSNIAYYPTNFDDIRNYLLVSQTGNYLLTSDGAYITE